MNEPTPQKMSFRQIVTGVFGMAVMFGAYYRMGDHEPGGYVEAYSNWLMIVGVTGVVLAQLWPRRKTS